MIIKNFFTFIFVLLLSFNAKALVKPPVLAVDVNAEQLQLTTQDTIKNTVFNRFNDTWIIFTDKNLKTELSLNSLKKFGVIDVEELIMKNGKGFRLRFKNSVPQISFVHNYENRTMTIKMSKSNTETRKTDTIKFRINTDEKNNNIKELYLDSTFVLDYAYSVKTGEKYIVATSTDYRFRYPTKLKNEKLYFLPTISGAAIISEKGEFLKIRDESTVELSDIEDKFFAELVRDDESINKFFYNTGIELIEKQLRDYSKFNEDVAKFKAKGKYDDALNRLNKALDTVDSFDYTKYNEELNPITTRRLEGINIEESDVIDLSKQDDGFFEIEEKSDEEFKALEKEDNDVLVPDFKQKNFAFKMEKLRLSAIKQPTVFKREKINITRMQINAYKSYFAENLDLAKLLRQDISGDIPRNNKALALYALSSAKQNQCKSTILLPERAGSIYTKDIKLWKAYCLVKQKKFEQALSIFETEFQRINTYPKFLKDDLRLSYAIALQGAEKYKLSSDELRNLKTEENTNFQNFVSYNLALNYLYQNESELAEKTFESLLFAKDKEVRYKARLEYLNILLQKGKTEKNIIVKALEDLRFDFRGGDVELNATMALAAIYLQEDELKKAMDLYKYIGIYFHQSPKAKEATETLFNIFYNLFERKQVTNSNLSEVSKLALFYDFIELTPSESKGDKIVSNVVDLLTKLELYNKAIILLNNQLNYKIDNEEEAEVLGEKLADLYLKTGDLKQALKTLVLTQQNTKDINYTDNAKIIKAKILVQYNKLDEAKKLLKTVDNSLVATYALANIYWIENKYPEIIDTLENSFLGKNVVLDEDGIINLSYLMVAYSLEKNIDKLKQIKGLYLSELKKVNLEHKIDFLIKLAGEDVVINKQDDALLDIWQNVIDVDNKALDFIQEYKDKIELREAIINRDYNKLKNKYNYGA